MFADWPAPSQRLEADFVTVVEGATDLRNDPSGGCDQLRVTHAGGINTHRYGVFMNTNRPDPLRCAALVLLSLCCAAFLIELNSSTPWPSTDPSAFLDWWERHGTATAAITLLRIVGTTLAGWGIFIGTAGLLASIRPSGLFARASGVV